MIIRVYRCVVVAGKEEEFRQYAYSTSHPAIRARKGLTAFYAGKALPDSGEPGRCMVQIWESEAALESQLGPDWRDAPLLPPEAMALIESQSVEHYELADEFRAGA